MSLSGAFGTYLPGGTIGRASVRLYLDASSYDKQLAEAQGLIEKTQVRMQQTGALLSKAVTLPVLAVGAASIKAASDYEASFAKIQGMTDASAKQIRVWKEEVLSLAGKTAQAPTALADGLYFLASAGLKTSQIMPVLEASSKAAAAGMGDLSDVAKLTANVLNAYAGTGLKATTVTDTLAGAIKAGSAEPNEFATALGRVLPIASKAGVSFKEVAASLAEMSNIGLDVNEGVTALRGVLNALEAPGTAAADTLHKVGLSVDEVRNVIQNQGILAALNLLQQATHGNIDELSTIIPNVRALTGAFSVSGNRAQAAADAFDQVTHSTGALQEAFSARKRTSAFQFQKLLNELRIAAIRLGTVMLPVVKDLVQQLTKWATAFANLDPKTREFIVKAGLIAAAAGPALIVLSKLVGVTRALVGAMAAGGVAGAAWAASLALVGAAAYKVWKYSQMSTDASQQWIDSIRSGQHSLQDYTLAVDSLHASSSRFFQVIHGEAPVLDAYQKTFDTVTLSWQAQEAAVGGNTQAQTDFVTVMTRAEGVNKKAQHTIATLFAAFTNLGTNVDALTRSQVANLLAVGDETDAINLLRRAYGNLLGPLKNAKDAGYNAANSADVAAEKTRGQAMAVERLNAALRDTPKHTTATVDVKIDVNAERLQPQIEAAAKAAIQAALARQSNQ